MSIDLPEVWDQEQIRHHVENYCHPYLEMRDGCGNRVCICGEVNRHTLMGVAMAEVDLYAPRVDV